MNQNKTNFRNSLAKFTDDRLIACYWGSECRGGRFPCVALNWRSSYSSWQNSRILSRKRAGWAKGTQTCVASGRARGRHSVTFLYPRSLSLYLYEIFSGYKNNIYRVCLLHTEITDLEATYGYLYTRLNRNKNKNWLPWENTLIHFHKTLII